MAVISMKQLLEAGVHFGHQTRKWNPKMSKYIYAARNDIHIIDLQLTVDLIEEAYTFVCESVKEGKTVLFVGTKKQASDAVKEEAERCGMYYVNSRWLGGTLTNFKTIRSRIDRMVKIEKMEQSGEFDLLPKKEVAKLKEEYAKLVNNLGGIREMNKLPGIMFVVDPHVEDIAVAEARKLNIPIVAITDTNCDPDLIDYVIPGNDDAIRAVKLIASVIANAVIEANQGETPYIPVVEEGEPTSIEEVVASVENIAPDKKEDETEPRRLAKKKPAEVKEEKKPEPVKEPEPEPVKEPEPEPVKEPEPEEEDDEWETESAFKFDENEEFVDEPETEEDAAEDKEEEKDEPVTVKIAEGEGDNVRYIVKKYQRGFTAKLIQSDKIVKQYYSEIKNELLSYTGVKSRESWKHESFYVGRKTLAKLTIRGKTLTLFVSLDPKQVIAEGRYAVVDMSEVTAHESTPTMYKIKSTRRLGGSKHLIKATLKGIEQNEKYRRRNWVKTLPYEDNDALVEKGLVKVTVEEE